MTSQPAGREFVDRIAAMEGRDGILSISIGHGFHAADVPEVGSKVLVIADGDQAKADALARRIGLDFIAMGRAGIPPHVKPEDVVATANAHAGMPVVFADRSSTTARATPAPVCSPRWRGSSRGCCT